MTEESTETRSQVSIPEKRVGQVSSILWISFGIFVIFQSQQLDYTDDFGPSAGFFPLWLGAIAIFLGVIMAIQASISRGEKREITIESKHAAYKMVLIIIALFIFFLLIERTGFFLSAGLLFLFLLYVVEKQSLKYSLIAAVLSFFIIWLVFDVVLKVQLPVGFMKFMRFI